MGVQNIIAIIEQVGSGWQPSEYYISWAPVFKAAAVRTPAERHRKTITLHFPYNTAGSSVPWLVKFESVSQFKC